MKHFCKIITIVLVLALVPAICFADLTYPQYTGANKGEAAVEERINIVFDNSGHSDVKTMMVDVVKAAAIAENTAIWLYPIAGSVEPVQVVPGKDFVDKYFTAFSKSSNEFKPENIMDKAREDLMNDTSVATKRFVLYANAKTSQLRSEYDTHKGIIPYIENTPDVVFTVLYSFGSVLEKRFISYNDFAYDYLSTKSLFEFLTVKNGYSSCDSVYYKDEGVLKIEKGKADNNVFVLAMDSQRIDINDNTGTEVYLGGCMMGTGAYENYKKSKKISGVALSYNHTLLETNDGNNSIAFALYTADGTTVNPLNDDIYIPLINANEVVVYYRSKKGAGVCSAETSYNAGQDKKILNPYAPVEKPAQETNKESELKVELIVDDTYGQDKSQNQNVVKTVFSVIGKILTGLLRIVFVLIRLLLFVFVILLIVSRKFRSYSQLFIMNTRFGPTYEKILMKVKSIIAEIVGSGVKAKGKADIKGDFIFISYASADLEMPNNRINLLVNELESRGIPCWISKDGITAGENYTMILPQVIKKCTVFLLFISTHSINSDEVVSEIATAKEHKKTIVPVQIEPFDLFGTYENWSFMLKQYQKKDLFSSKKEEVKPIADQIEKIYNDLKK